MVLVVDHLQDSLAEGMGRAEDDIAVSVRQAVKGEAPKHLDCLSVTRYNRYN